MASRAQGKIEVLNLINSEKDILFGKFSDELTAEEKFRKWDEIAERAKDVGVLKSHQNGKHLREVTWQNWRKRSVVIPKFIWVTHV